MKSHILTLDGVAECEIEKVAGGWLLTMTPEVLAAVTEEEK